MRLAAFSLMTLLILANAHAFAQQGPPPVTVAKPVVKMVVEDDSFVGRFEAKSDVTVRARISGYLQQVHFVDGALVNEGDLLFTIDQRPFQTELRQAEALTRVAQATYEFTKSQLDRARSLVERGNIAQSTLDERQEAFLSASGALEQAVAAQESARIDLEYTEVRAPLSGRIDRSQISPGNLVLANETILTSIVSRDPVYFYFDIDERYFLAYSRDARARGTSLQDGGGGLEVKVTLSDKKIPPQLGKLDFSENRIDRNTGTMRVRAELPNPDDILTPGLFGTINVPGSSPYKGVLIPDSALVADQNRRLVMTVDQDGKIVPRPVEPGPRIDGYRVIRSGLDGSETIVIKGIIRARPGTMVAATMVELPPVAEN